jgi:Cdc6-like AAA superfamily ATPase
VSIDPSGSPAFTFTHDPLVPVYDSLTDILNLPLNINKDKRWIVVMDEFQDIEKLNGTETEKCFRSVMQYHSRISYVFLGSKTHLIGQMFSRQDRAFYGFGKLIRIEKIPAIEMEKYIIDRMEKSGSRCDASVAKEIIAVADNVPYFVQFLASETWTASGNNEGIAGFEHIQQAVENILNNQQDYFHQLFDSLSSYQKKVLKALSADRNMIYSVDYMKNFELGAVSSTQRAVEKLINTGIIEKDQESISFSNPFFLKYLQQRVFA